MYLGPDSLALAAVASSLSQASASRTCARERVRGSSRAAGASSIPGSRPRRAAFCRLNGALNCGGRRGGDRVSNRGRHLRPDTGEPPYVATPPSLSYDAFAAGGPTARVQWTSSPRRGIWEDGRLAVVFS